MEKTYLHHHRSKTLSLITILLFVSMTIKAHLVVTKTTCNHQSTPTAIVEDKIIVGWQYKDSNNWPIRQTKYQIEIRVRGAFGRESDDMPAASPSHLKRLHLESEDRS